MNISNQQFIPINSPFSIIKGNKKIYQKWRGNNRFLFDGKIYIGAQYYRGILTFFYVVIICLFYLICVIKVSQYIKLI